MNWNLLWVFLFGLISQFLLVNLGKKMHLYSKANFRRKKVEQVPLVGGLGIFLTVVYAQFFGSDEMTQKILLSTSPLVIIGLIDDYIELSAKIKFPAQILASIVFVNLVGAETLFYSKLSGSPELGSAITVFFMVVLINAYNFLDGTDGQVSVISFVATLAIGALTQFDVAILTPLLLANLSFLVLNAPPARVYLGEVGSGFLGFTMAALSTQVEPSSNSWMSFWGMNFLFSLAFCDMWAAIIRRVSEQRSPMRGDRQHFHHKLELLGLGRVQILIVTGTIMSVSSITGVYLFTQAPEPQLWWVALSGGLSLSLVYFGVLLLERIVAKRTASVVNHLFKTKWPRLNELIVVSSESSFIRFDFSVYMRELQNRSYEEVANFVEQIDLFFKRQSERTKFYYLAENNLIIESSRASDQSILDWRKNVSEELKTFLSEFRILRSESEIPEGVLFLGPQEAHSLIQSVQTPHEENHSAKLG